VDAYDPTGTMSTPPDPPLSQTPWVPAQASSANPQMHADPPAPDPEPPSYAADPSTTDPSRSALADALATVGDRWTLLLVAALLDGPRRFGELQGEVQGIAPNVLSQRLRALERNALVIARPYSERPPRFVYELSASGQELAGMLRLLAGWGARNAEGAAVPRHGVCGTPMEARWWCPTCERPVTEDESDELHFA
jgi:DNA-binding HxlR family transcriptional regulator